MKATKQAVLKDGLILLAAFLVVALIVGLLIFLLLPTGDLAKSGDFYKSCRYLSNRGPHPAGNARARGTQDRQRREFTQTGMSPAPTLRSTQVVASSDSRGMSPTEKEAPS